MVVKKHPFPNRLHHSPTSLVILAVAVAITDLAVGTYPRSPLPAARLPECGVVGGGGMDEATKDHDRRVCEVIKGAEEMMKRSGRRKAGRKAWLLPWKCLPGSFVVDFLRPHLHYELCRLMQSSTCPLPGDVASHSGGRKPELTGRVAGDTSVS